MTCVGVVCVKLKQIINLLQSNQVVNIDIDQA